MKDPKEPLSTLVGTLQEKEQRAQEKERREQKELLEDELRDITSCADVYVPGMNEHPEDEFYQHAGTIRAMGRELLEKCAKVSLSDREALTQIKEQFEVLRGFVEYWCTLREPENVEK